MKSKLIIILAQTVLSAAAYAATICTTPSGRYLAVPVENGTPATLLEVFDGDLRIVRTYMHWAGGTTNWTGSLDLGPVTGHALRFVFSGKSGQDLSAADLVFADKPFPAPKGQFDEPWRPQFHFTPPLGWNNDPNGLSYHNGEWHMFYQHFPFGVKWNSMHWGHAVSTDLVHWRDLGDVLAPDDYGAIFSGSAITDFDGTAGLGKNVHVLFHTAHNDKRTTQHMAWSRDGRNYVKWPQPVINACTDANRDPKVFWYRPGRHWVLVVYGTMEGNRHCISVYTSKDLKEWTLASHIPGDLMEEGKYLYECPDLFELPIRGETTTRWVLTAANRQYAIGSFDGRTFRPEEERLEQMVPYEDMMAAYAWQTFADAPDGRRIQIAWCHFNTLKASGGAMFNQGMTLPVELALVRTKQGLRLAKFPVKELAALRDGDAKPLASFDGELAEVEFSCRPGADALVTLDLRSEKIAYSAARKTLTVRGTATRWDLDANGSLGLHIFVDRMGLEIFSMDGLQYLPLPHIVPDPANRRLAWHAQGAKTPVTDTFERAWRLKRAIGGIDSERRLTQSSITCPSGARRSPR